ncbi:hypothetical protein H257_15221 [Aphanomyces astaci]|uniref:Uncharacterized protein n=1 Tax=Aphanomyces astaci TaxID=112090 RepID=W4FQ73_APHAT|nr:hypothetical protein H257_15221 [Aphanomyces astaci]ETV69086.1 hypothetical protein H257_15221 [Aphanomyces astaci]|eukprot:XP_009841545.1 hypothetical protein H257_15221 [Aphanomyces astaci]
MQRSKKKVVKTPAKRRLRNWTTSPPCEAQLLLNDIIQRANVKSATDLWNEIPLFQEYSVSSSKSSQHASNQTMVTTAIIRLSLTKVAKNWPSR